MHKAAQTRLNAADNHRQLRPKLFHLLRINAGRMVRTLANLAAGSILVNGTLMLAHSIAAEHGIKVAAGNHYAQARLAQGGKIFYFIPRRLAQHRHLVALRLQHAADNRWSEGRMVYIGIAADEQKINLLPATLNNFLM